MRILMIGQKQIPSREGGVDVVVEKLATRMADLGHDITLYVRRKKGYKPNKIYKSCKIKKIFTINRQSLAAILYSFFATIKGLFSKNDVIHFHAEGNCLFLWMTKFSKKKIVVTVHGLDWKRSRFNGIGSKILKKSERRIAKYADEIIVLSKNDQDYFLKTYNRKTILIPNGFEKYEVSEPNLIKEKFNLEKNKYILYLARIVSEKGLHYLIEAYKKINTDCKLVIAGNPNHARAYYDEMVKLADGNKNIIFVGFVQGQMLEELYSNTLLYVLPSEIEGMAMTLLEAFGHSCFCLVSDIPENHLDDMNCIYFENKNVESLKQKLEDFLNNPREFKETTTFIPWDDITTKTLEVYMR
ncbi:MAG: glycosyltransferase family 4 protein [Erysipelotrichales bacterium]|nr:glycosyltransferase family 4 protein [Erysipelotrichales bacterium]